MLKSVLVIGLLGAGLLGSVSAFAHGGGSVTYVSPEPVNEFPTYIIPPRTSVAPPVVIGVEPRREYRPERPHEHPYRPQPYCVSPRQADDMLGKQANNLYTGRQSGQLTRRELDRLNEKQNFILREKASMLTDNCLSAAENDRLLRLLQELERDTYQARTDDDYRRAHYDQGYGQDRPRY